MKHQKIILALIATTCIVVLATAALAGTPKRISYQGKATDASGSPLPDGDYGFTFQLFEYPTAGLEKWVEIATVHTVGGLFTHLLGSIAPLPAWLFSERDSLFLQVSIGSQHLSPRIPIVSVGYALSVNSVNGALGGEIKGTISLTSVTGNTAVRLNPFSSDRGYIDLSRGDGDLGITMSGSPAIGMHGTARSAILDMNQAGTQSVRLPSSAIEASEMLDEPGVGSDNNTNITLTGPIQFLAGRTMTAPTDGYVLVIATAHAVIQHLNGRQSTCILDVSDNITSFVSSTIARITLPSSLPSGLYEFPLSSHALFPIAAGPQAYYALGSKAGDVNVTVYDVQLSECFFPTAYTTVSNPMPPPGSAATSSTSFDPEAERLEAQAYHNARIQAELDRMKAELETVKQEMSNLKDSGESKR